MKTRTKIVFYLILFLIMTALVIAGYPQGLVNDGGYITASSSNYIKFSGNSNALLINSDADQVTLGNMAVDFTGAGTYSLTITDTSYITVEGSLSLSDTLIMECDTGIMASLITNGTVSGAYAKVEQYTKSDQWNMVSSPVASAQAEVYEGSYLLDWDEPDSTWTYLISLTDPLNTGEGYFIWPESSISSPENVAYTGLLNTGNVAITGMSYTTGSGKGNGWNLVGNPYPSAIEWTSSWTTSGLDATIYIYDGANYKTWNYNLGGFGSMGNGYIPPTQGFWVKANSSSPSMTIPNSERTHAAQSFYKSSGVAIETLFSVMVSNGTYSDELIMGFHEGAKSGYSGEYDAYKLFGIDECPQVFCTLGDEKLSTSIMEPLNGKKTKVMLGFKAGSDGTYHMVFDNLATIGSAYKVYLKDLKATGESKLIDVTKYPEYSFYANQGMDENRFVLYFYPLNENENWESEADIDEAGIATIYSSNKDVFINYQEDEPAEVVIYNLVGKEITRKPLTNQHLNKFNLEVKKGYYVVKVLTAHQVESQKVFIN